MAGNEERLGPSKRALVYHEAGHAVVGLVLGRRLVDIHLREEILSSGRSVAGYCQWEPPDEDVPESHAAIGITALAGRIAEARAVDTLFPRGDNGDEKEARQAAELVARDDQSSGDLLAEWRREAASLVEEHWDAIRELAESGVGEVYLHVYHVERRIGHLLPPRDGAQ